MSSDQFKCQWSSSNYPTKTIDDYADARIKIYCENTGSDDTYVPSGISCQCAEKVSCDTPEDGTDDDTDYYSWYCHNSSSKNNSAQVKSVTCDKGDSADGDTAEDTDADSCKC